jgi:hypothetical protein
MLTDLYEEWSNGQWEWNRGYTYTYNAIGRLLTGLGQYWYNGQWVNEWRMTNAYDMLGNLSSCSVDSWVNSSWTPFSGGMGWGKVGPRNFAIADSAGNSYPYWDFYNLTLVYKAVLTGVATESSNLPLRHSLSQNYPNPFNPSTTIRYELPKASQVSLAVYDILGRRVSVLVNDKRDAGVHEVKFDGTRLTSGVYFYRLQAGSFVETKKLVLTR